MATYLNKISNINVAEYLCNNENDLADIHIKDIAPGSTAYCITECKNYILDEDKKWKEFDLENKSNGGEEESSTKYCHLSVYPMTDLLFYMNSTIFLGWYIKVDSNSSLYIPKDEGIYMSWEKHASGTISFFDMDNDPSEPPFLKVNIDNETGYKISDISNFPDNIAMDFNVKIESA